MVTPDRPGDLGSAIALAIRFEANPSPVVTAAQRHLAVQLPEIGLPLMIRAAAVAAVGQPTALTPLPDDRTANMQHATGVARAHLPNAASGKFDHPSIKTSINPVDNPVEIR